MSQRVLILGHALGALFVKRKRADRLRKRALDGNHRQIYLRLLVPSTGKTLEAMHRLRKAARR